MSEVEQPKRKCRICQVELRSLYDNHNHCQYCETNEPLVDVGHTIVADITTDEAGTVRHTEYKDIFQCKDCKMLSLRSDRF